MTCSILGVSKQAKIHPSSQEAIVPATAVRPWSYFLEPQDLQSVHSQWRDTLEWRSNRTHSISRVSNSITDDLSGLPCGEEDVVPDADTRDGECITIRQRPCTYCTRCAERHDVDVPLWDSGNPGCVRWIKGGFLLHQQTYPAVFSFRVQLVSNFRVDSRVGCGFLLN